MKLFRSQRNPALTRLEVLMVLAALGLLAAVALPALAGGKPRSDAAVCASNLRQLGMAVLMYSLEEDGYFPPRSSTNRWPQRLFKYYGNAATLRCPSDVPNPSTFGGPGTAPLDSAPRSFLFNGFSDYFGSTPTNGSVLSESALVYPAQTVLLGEKVGFSGHFWMDFWTGDDYSELEQTRHGAQRAGPSGSGSNHAMADGGVRMLYFGQGLFPTNLWAVTDVWRMNSF
jgi:type II secretory pathway pseudopilin PulG